MPRPATLDHLRSQKKPVRRTVTVPLDSEVADRHMEAKSSYDFAKRRLEGQPDDRDLQDKFTDVEEAYLAATDEMEDNSVTFTFRGVGREAFEELLLEHQPTKSQRDQARKEGAGNLNWNFDTFPIALIAASSVDPELSESDVKEIWNSPDWNQGELMALFGAALDVNQTRRIVDLGKD